MFIEHIEINRTVMFISRVGRTAFRSRDTGKLSCCLK